MAQWNKNTVPKCDVGKCSDEVFDNGRTQI